MNEELIELIPGNPLITDSPEAGRRLAVKLARLTIRYTQPDEQVRAFLRPQYATDAKLLIALSHVVAQEFATIAQANNYWK